MQLFDCKYTQLFDCAKFLEGFFKKRLNLCYTAEEEDRLLYMRYAKNKKIAARMIALR